MSTEEKEQILKVIFDVSDNMSESDKNYMLGYIKGFEDKSNMTKSDREDAS